MPHEGRAVSSPKARSSYFLPALTMLLYRRGTALQSGRRSPSRQTVNGWAASAQPPCPAHDPCCCDRCFHPVALVPQARKAPEVKAQAGAGDRVQIRGLRHQVKPTARTIREGFGLISQVRPVAPRAPRYAPQACPSSASPPGLSLSQSPFPVLNRMARFLSTATDSPVRGFRPVRALCNTVEKAPKPRSSTRSPRESASLI
ncbi:hypothetical protein LY56_03348 [Roseinatronobacter thiooxidans]|uniref:Uncharacterized protein n=1 Tax=Roseinatronobacter thiooxidans TaxID=121821 RepID=A0A2W7PL03_9RHOB|nr:hypothetical protein LY56_03348 [Roseinatronobacter thiooxidans]